MSLYDFLAQRWDRIVAQQQLPAKEPWLQKFVRIINQYPMDPVEADGWVKEVRTHKDLQIALLVNYTNRFKVSFYSWRLREHFQFIYIIYGKLGMGKTVFALTLATLTLQIYPNAKIYCIMSFEEMIKAISECPNHSVLIFDEDVVPSGEESDNIKEYLTNETKFLRLKEINLILSYKKRKQNDMGNGSFQMFGFNPETGYSRTMFYTSDGAPLGIVSLQKNFDQALYEEFDRKKLEIFIHLTETGGRAAAFSDQQDNALVQEFQEVFQTNPVLPSEIEGAIRNYAAKRNLSIPELTLKRVVKRLKPLLREANQSRKKQTSDMVINPEIVKKATERIANDRAGQTIKSMPRIESWLRTYCTDIIPLEQMNAVASLIYANRRADRETITSFKQEKNESATGYTRADQPMEVWVDEDLHFIDLMLSNIEPYVENREDFEMFKDRCKGMNVNQIAEKWLGSEKDVRPVNAAILRVQEGPLGVFGMERAYCDRLRELGYVEGIDFKYEGSYGHRSDIINWRDQEVLSLKVNTNELTTKNKQGIAPREIQDALDLDFPLFEGVFVIREKKYKKFLISILRDSQCRAAPEIPCPPEARGGGAVGAVGGDAGRSVPEAGAPAPGTGVPGAPEPRMGVPGAPEPRMGMPEGREEEGISPPHKGKESGEGQVPTQKRKRRRSV